MKIGVSQQGFGIRERRGVIALYLEEFIIALLVFHSVEMGQHAQRE